MNRISIFVLLLVSIIEAAFSQSSCQYQQPYKRKVDIMDVKIEAKLDTIKHLAKGKQFLRWTNTSDVSVTSLRFYMYLNAFRNLNSSFLKGSDGIIFGSDIKQRKADEWGYIHLDQCRLKGIQDTIQWHYIHPDDGNKDDQSVLELLLPSPILPGQTIELNMLFTAKLPKFIARAGYSRDYYAFLHWFPQPGVWMKNRHGQWSWNCHQFFRGTEFFADFAHFDVSLTVPQNMIVAGSGCMTSEKNIQGTKEKIVTFDGRDIIDFAWIAYPHFELYTDTWNDVDIKMYIPEEHCAMASRYMQAVKNALNYFDHVLGRYPYPVVNLIDPPIHGLGSGFMEYPMLITCASFHYVPYGIKTIESLAVHEFSHQYFMAVLASNEKEEAWMDEGFVTFFEDEIADLYYGNKTSIFDIMGYKSGNRERSRLEYTTMENIHEGPIARPGWLYSEGTYKELVYAKTATILQTLKGLIGSKKFYTLLKNYYQQYQFTHPTEIDFTNTVKKIVGDSLGYMTIDQFFYSTLHDTVHCDYKLDQISNTGFNVVNEGLLSLPIDIVVTYTDGSQQWYHNKGSKTSEYFSVSQDKALQSIAIDPEHKIYLDVNFNNNSYVVKSEIKPGINFGAKVMSWAQFVFHSLTFLV